MLNFGGGAPFILGGSFILGGALTVLVINKQAFKEAFMVTSLEEYKIVVRPATESERAQFEYDAFRGGGLHKRFRYDVFEIDPETGEAKEASFDWGWAGSEQSAYACGEGIINDIKSESSLAGFSLKDNFENASVEIRNWHERESLVDFSACQLGICTCNALATLLEEFEEVSVIGSLS